MGINFIRVPGRVAAAAALAAGVCFAQEAPWATTASWGSYGHGDDELHWPCGVALAADGDVYVADTLNDRVQVYTAAGAYVRTLAAGPAPALRRPSAVAAGEDGVVYVGDAGNDRVVAFDEGAGSAVVWGGYGSRPGLFNGVRGVVSLGGFLIVADAYNRRVQVLGGDGVPVGELPAPPGGFVEPYGLAAGEDGVLVTDAGAGAIHYFKTVGNGVCEYERVIPGPGPRPIAVAALSDGRVAVVDEEREGLFVGPSADGGWTPIGAGQLFNPRGVAGGPAGAVYVVDAGSDRVVRYSNPW